MIQSETDKTLILKLKKFKLFLVRKKSKGLYGAKTKTNPNWKKYADWVYFSKYSEHGGTILIITLPFPLLE